MTPPPQKPPILKIDPGTLVFILAALILTPLLLTGFWAQ
jgi:hypothetical protein